MQMQMMRTDMLKLEKMAGGQRSALSTSFLMAADTVIFHLPMFQSSDLVGSSRLDMRISSCHISSNVCRFAGWRGRCKIGACAVGRSLVWDSL
jgi:hypothetical protein